MVGRGEQLRRLHSARAAAAAWAPTLRSGVAIAPVFTRGPALLAQTAASMADAAPGRFALGIGASSPAIVERWNGLPFEDPYARTRDVLRFLRRALAGEKVTERYDTFAVEGFRLGVVPGRARLPSSSPRLRPRMLRLAGEEGDGAIVNWLSAEDVAQVAPYVGDKEIVARIFVVPSDDFAEVRAIAARSITNYLTVGAYARVPGVARAGPALTPMWDAWATGDRARALELVPDEVVDQLIVWGTADEIRARIERYVANGVTTTAPAILASGASARRDPRALSSTAVHPSDRDLVERKRATRGGVAEHLELIDAAPAPEEPQQVGGAPPGGDVALGVLPGHHEVVAVADDQPLPRRCRCSGGARSCRRARSPPPASRGRNTVRNSSMPSTASSGSTGVGVSPAASWASSGGCRSPGRAAGTRTGRCDRRARRSTPRRPDRWRPGCRAAPGRSSRK